MSKIFTDENGAQFEIVDEHMLSPEHDGLRTVCLKPVKQQPKWGVELYENSKNIKIFLEELGISEDQAQLIKAGIESVMEYISGGGDWSDVSNDIRAAKHSMRDEETKSTRHKL